MNSDPLISIGIISFNNENYITVFPEVFSDGIQYFVDSNNYVYTYNLETKEQYKLTNVLNKDIDVEDLVTAKVIRFKSFDGTEIPAIYYLPHQASKDFKVPAMVWVHGGPGGHGSKFHRALGSIGNRKPTRTHKGKKMHGHYGVDQISLRSVPLEIVNQAAGIIGVRGPVPGARTSLVQIYL